MQHSGLCSYPLFLKEIIYENPEESAGTVTPQWSKLYYFISTVFLYHHLKHKAILLPFQVQSAAQVSNVKFPISGRNDL